MDEMITRVMEIEKQCAEEVEQAEVRYVKKIEAHKRFLQEKKAGQYSLITAAENARLTQAVENEKKQNDTATAALRRDSESRLQDPVLNEAIKEDILSTLLMS